MEYIIRILRSLGIIVEIKTSSEEALSTLAALSFDAVISDMQRGDVADEGIRFLQEMRRREISVPVIFTVGRFNPALGTPAFAFGITNRVDEILNLLFDVLERAYG